MASRLPLQYFLKEGKETGDRVVEIPEIDYLEFLDVKPLANVVMPVVLKYPPDNFWLLTEPSPQSFLTLDYSLVVSALY
jgi:hypothetical protein